MLFQTYVYIYTYSFDDLFRMIKLEIERKKNMLKSRVRII
jgi:hypothetical protein